MAGRTPLYAMTPGLTIYSAGHNTTGLMDWWQWVAIVGGFFFLTTAYAEYEDKGEDGGCY